MAVTFIHCADLHLGRQRLGGKLPESDLADAFSYIVEYTIKEKADGLLIAGDLFDTPNIQPEHLQTAIDCLNPLREREIPVFAIEGNHDRPSLSAELVTWVRYLNDQGYLHLLSIPFTAEGPQITGWDPGTRRGSYLIHKGVRIIGAGYLGAGTVRRMKAIAASLQETDAGRDSFPTVLLLHAGPEYLVHEGGGFDRESLEFLHNLVDYLALGHIHKPINYHNWAVNPGTAENIRLEEAVYGPRGSEKDGRGMAVVKIDTEALLPQPEVSILPVPKRPVGMIHFDCSPFTGKNLPEKITTGLVARIRNLNPTPQTVVRVELEGRLDLQRAGLDPVELAALLERDLGLFAVEIGLTGLNSFSSSGWEANVDSPALSREELERQAILGLLRDSPPGGLPEDRWPDLAELFMNLKEDVRHQKRPEDILDRLARHPAVRELAAIMTKEREEPRETTDQVAVGDDGGET